MLLLLVPIAAHAQSYTISLLTDHEIQGAEGYDGYDIVQVSGNVIPPPPSGSSVTVTTKAPNGTVIYVDDEPLEANTGAYEDSILTGCTATWVAGYYTILVTLNGSPGVNASTQFQYTVDYPPVDMVSVAVTPQSSSGTQLLSVTGQVDACSGNSAETSASIIVKNPAGASIYTGSLTVLPAGQPELGTFALNLTAGSSPLWVPGTYSATVFYNSNSVSPTPATASATFVYGETSTASSTSSGNPSTSGVLSSSSASSQMPTTVAASSTTSAASSKAAAASSTTSGFSSNLYYGAGFVVVAAVVVSFLGLRSRKSA